MIDTSRIRFNFPARESTQWDGCEYAHQLCAIHVLCNEVDRLRKSLPSVGCEAVMGKDDDGARTVPTGWSVEVTADYIVHVIGPVVTHAHGGKTHLGWSTSLAELPSIACYDAMAKEELSGEIERLRGASK